MERNIINNEIFLLILSILISIAAIIWMIKKPDKRLWAFPVLFAMINSVLFYMYVLIKGEYSTDFIIRWSSIKNIIVYLSIFFYWSAKAHGVITINE